MVALAFGIASLAMRELKRHNTTFKVGEPSTAVVTTGIYGYSRNPIYVAGAVLSLGVGLLLNSWWLLVTLAVALVIIRYAVIKQEEAYLTGKFESAYTDYRHRVRRWL